MRQRNWNLHLHVLLLTILFGLEYTLRTLFLSSYKVLVALIVWHDLVLLLTD